MLVRVSTIVIPALLIAAICWDPRLRLQASRAFGPLYKVSETPEPRPSAPQYEPCVAGCCDDEPDFCSLLENQSPFGSMENACGYATVRSRCVKTCGRCEVLEASASSCEDEWPRCDESVRKHPEFCSMDAGAEKCRRSCGHCARPACADSLTYAGTCAKAKLDLRRCAKPHTSELCPQTCGKCGSGVALQELLRRQPCVDQPGCELSDDEVADQTLDKFRNCEDIGFCGPTKSHPTTKELCADPMFRDTLCRGTCGACTPTPPLRGFLAETRKAKPLQCTAQKARECPKRCGVCKPDGKRSKWQVDDVDRLVVLGPPKPVDDTREAVGDVVQDVIAHATAD